MCPGRVLFPKPVLKSPRQRGVRVEGVRDDLAGGRTRVNRCRGVGHRRCPRIGSATGTRPTPDLEC